MARKVLNDRIKLYVPNFCTAVEHFSASILVDQQWSMQSKITSPSLLNACRGITDDTASVWEHIQQLFVWYKLGLV
jgi:hypothetical protein